MRAFRKLTGRLAFLLAVLLLACTSAAPPAPPKLSRPLAELADTPTPVVVAPAGVQTPIATAPALVPPPAVVPAETPAPAPAERVRFSGDRAWEEDRMLAETIGSRPAGSAGADRAADYIAGRLESFGYQVERQPFKFTGYEDHGSTLEVLSPNPRKIEANTLIYSAAGDVSGQVIFAGLGQPEDFRSANVRGKIALVQRGEIRFSDKVKNAQDAGALAVIVYNNAEGNVQGTLAVPSSIPALAISNGQGELLRRAPGTTVHLTVNGTVKETTAYNVIGTLPGHTEDTIVFGGHYDSVPAGPGANDNGSGTATALEAARVLALTGPHNFTLRVIAFGAEENGLIGSRRYVEALSAEQRKKIVAMINLDMVGVGDTWMIGGTRDLQSVVRSVADSLGVGTRELSADLNGSSDHASFAGAGIPAAFIYLSDDPNYHSPEDKVQYVQPQNLETAGRILLTTISRLENR